MPTALAMRVLVAVQDAYRRDKHFLMGDIADAVCDELRISRATASRHMRTALDVLAVPYDDDPIRAKAIREKQAARLNDARACGWPNGVPAGRAGAA
ncbi:hypothetical protein [Dyella sp. AD56]|uniref:hypothetical protein n=1 Tax=Dyella sp. AD56 TaxID=1528744 RepID=UPI001E5C3C2E|nr:hypothetical protein [Dyella sp. AD56]